MTTKNTTTDSARGGGRLLTLALLAALLLAGCHAGRKATAPTVVPAAADSVATPAPPRAYTVVNFEATVEGVGVAGQVRLAEDSVIWLSVTKLLEVGRGLATPDSLWLRSSLLGRDEAMDYATLRRLTGVEISFDEVQQMLTADDAEARLGALARRLGVAATVRITARRRVEHLTFPYTKPIKQ